MLLIFQTILRKTGHYIILTNNFNMTVLSSTITIIIKIIIITSIIIICTNLFFVSQGIVSSLYVLVACHSLFPTVKGLFFLILVFECNWRFYGTLKLSYHVLRVC